MKLGTLFVLVLIAAAASQLFLFGIGLYRTSADESARSLLAYHLDWNNAFEPWIWPPFYKWFVGLFLKIHNDVFYVPRALVFVFGLMVIVALAHLSQTLFNDRRVAVVTAILSILIPHRLIFSVTPMSDIFYYFFVIVAAAFVMTWLRNGKNRDIIIACMFLLFAATVRYEACFIGAVLGLIIFYKFIVGREFSLKIVIVCGLILSAFPVYWVLMSLYWYGSLENISVTKWQFIENFGYNYTWALKSNILTRFGVDVLVNPALLLGLGAMAFLFVTDRTLRWWLIVFFVPLAILTVVMVATLSIPGASPWRMGGLWTLFTLAFTAFALVWLSERIASSTTARRRILAILVLLAVLPFAVRTGMIAGASMHESRSEVPRLDRQVGLYLREQLAEGADASNVLIDSVNNLEFLDVIAGSAIPDRFVINAGDAPLEVALYLPMRERYYREGNTEIIAKYLTDRFDLANGGSGEALAASDIAYVVVRNEEFIQALDASSLVDRESTFGVWVVYAVVPDATPEQASRN